MDVIKSFEMEKESIDHRQLVMGRCFYTAAAIGWGSLEKKILLTHQKAQIYPIPAADGSLLAKYKLSIGWDAKTSPSPQGETFRVWEGTIR